jgi:hypothetical protein
MIFVAVMAKAFRETAEIFYTTIESFMAGSCLTFELANLDRIMRVWGADDCWLPSVSLVADNQLSDGNFVFQTFRSKDANVISTSGKWTIHPNQFFVVYRYS